MKNQKGITLIALVITIIVLLILAGVSIAMLTGENGILTQANSSKTETNKAEAIEKISLALNAVKSKVYEKEVGSSTYDPLNEDTTAETGDDLDNLEAAITGILKVDKIVPKDTSENAATANNGKYVYFLNTTTKELEITYYNTTTEVGTAAKPVKGTIKLDKTAVSTYLDISQVALVK